MQALCKKVVRLSQGGFALLKLKHSQLLAVLDLRDSEDKTWLDLNKQGFALVNCLTKLTYDGFEDNETVRDVYYYPEVAARLRSKIGPRCAEIVVLDHKVRTAPFQTFII